MGAAADNRAQSLPWGRDGQIEFDLPSGWSLLGRFIPADAPPLPDLAQAMESALLNPIGSESLIEMAAGRKKVVVVVDDISRPTPVHLMIGKVLDHLAWAGIDLKSVTLVASTGLHRSMGYDDMVAKVGREALGKVNWESHDCHDKARLIYLGKTVHGTPLHINRTVAGADLRVLIGGIRPHPHAGFGGGYKLILPGVAGVKSIAANHAICAHPKYFFMLGSGPEENPMRRDLEEVGVMLSGQTFLINAVLNSNMDIAGIFCGHPIKAHREGIRLARQAAAVKIPRQAHVVISDSFPMDIDLRQGVKAIADVLFAARPGGVLIAALRCEEGLGNMRIPKLNLSGLPDFIWKPIVWMLSMVISKVALPGTSPEERFSTYFMLKALLRNSISVYAPTVADQAAGLLPGVTLYSGLQEAVDAAARLYPSADVIIFPCGGAVYPVLAE